MFLWDKSVTGINTPAKDVVHLFRSMREVQLALPGVPAQQATAYLCQYKHQDGFATTAVFHLHKSKLLAFYFSDPPEVTESGADSMLTQGLNFVESMGFLLTDQDIHLLEEADLQSLWDSLPLQAGLDAVEPAGQGIPLHTQPAAETAGPPAVREAAPQPGVTGGRGAATTVTSRTPETEPDSTPEPVDAGLEELEELAEEVDDKVDDLLAAVEAMRAKRPGLRARKAPPTEEEMLRRREKLCNTAGRILASL